MIWNGFPIRVTPRAGVWIETTLALKPVTNGQSRPVRACGLKREIKEELKDLKKVTPRAGVWIETS